jgi:3-oxoacyl-[acyl-carrier-protein] synthase-3
VRGAGLRSLAVAYPPTIRTNDYYRERYPAQVAASEERRLAKLWSAHGGAEPSCFDQAFEPYKTDPFRGTVERRTLGPGEPVLPLEVSAARRALAAAGLEAADVDLVLSASFLPDQPGLGNGAFLVRELGMVAPAWNLESTCSSATAALRLAVGQVRSGDATHVLCVVSCSYSRVMEPDDNFGWFLGDGCIAFVVGPCEDGYGYLASKVINTADTCGEIAYAMELDGDGRPCLRIHAGAAAGRALRDSAGEYLQRCVHGAVAAAGIELSDVDFFAFNTPTAWYADFCVRELGIRHEQTIDTYPQYANGGPVLWPTNLHHAASAGLVRPGNLVLVYSVGSVSSAGATVMRWGEVGLGPLPTRSLEQDGAPAP